MEKKQQELKGKQNVLQQDHNKLVKVQTCLKVQQVSHEQAAQKVESQKEAVIKREVLGGQEEHNHAEDLLSVDIGKKTHN